MHIPVFEVFVEFSLLVVLLNTSGFGKLLLMWLLQAFRDPEGKLIYFETGSK